MGNRAGHGELMLSVPQIARIQDKNLADALQKIVDYSNQAVTANKADPTGLYPAPKQIAQLSVLGGQGEADIQITDNSIVGSGTIQPLNYWLEYSTDPNFINPPPYQVSLGAARNARLKVPQQKLYFRAYSQYSGSHPSTPTVHGGTLAAPVDCSTGASPPMQAAQGSGSNAASQPGKGYGLLARFAT